MAKLPSLREVYRTGGGPSSSHTIGPLRAARLYRGRTPEARRYRVTLYGSLAATGRAHMTDHAVTVGLAPALCDFQWDESALPRHPNGIRFAVVEGPAAPEWLVYSVGGGALEDDQGVVEPAPAVNYPVACVAEALDWCHATRRHFWSLPAERETDLWPWMAEVWRTMREAVGRGLESDQDVLPGGLDVTRKAGAAFARARNLSGVMRDLSHLSAYALAVAEENAAGGTVVTAPTCGSAGVLPAILYYFAADQKVGERHILQALATAGLIGASVKANGSVSGAEVGCQGEVGVACAMAAAAATQLLGGTPAQTEYAAEMALEHHLGLTCDPVMGLVQIPCIERNAIAAMRALECATYALLGDGRHTISFDEAVEVMCKTGRDMQSAYRETAHGGLAELWSRRRERLNDAARRTP